MLKSGNQKISRGDISSRLPFAESSTCKQVQIWVPTCCDHCKPSEGVNVLAEDTTPSFVLVNAIFLLGTFTFAVVLGVVSDDIGNELKVRPPDQETVRCSRPCSPRQDLSRPAAA